jgi:hypothetical protein
MMDKNHPGLMRGQQERSGSLFSYVSIEDRISTSHPLRPIRMLAAQTLDRLNPTFCELYASEGLPSGPPEQLLAAGFAAPGVLRHSLGAPAAGAARLQLPVSLFRWFVELSPDDPIWYPSTFTKNRQRLLNEQR